MASPLERITRAAERLRLAEEQAETVRDELYAEVRAAHKAGASLAAIARAWGVTRQRVAAVIGRPSTTPSTKRGGTRRDSAE